MDFVALLRAVNVGGRKLPMGELRALAVEIGLERPETYIQSGNLLFSSAGGTADPEAMLEYAIRRRFGFDAPVIVRTASQWSAHVSANPFPDESAREPNRVMMILSKAPLARDAAAIISGRARTGERIAVAGGALWGCFPAGVGTSLLTPNLFNKAAGSPATARNWRTVLKLQAMIEARG